jgi:Flp pilus assembly protein TadD
MGAAMRRAGNQGLAEFSYLRALRADDQNFSALNNLAALYALQGREAEAGRIAKRVDRYRRTNPYYQHFLANLFFAEGRDAEAVLLLRAAIRLKRDEPEFYQALARTYTHMGDEEQARKTLQQGKKYQGKTFIPPGRDMNHRFWVNWMQLN